MNKQITTIVLTGGPCAGKTSALVKVTEHFSSLGYKVFTIPEVPTLFLQAGMDYLTPNQDYFYEGEKATLKVQLQLEDSFRKIAERIDEPVLIVCDRGTLDISTYLKEEMWERLTKTAGVTNEGLRDRYDAVLHLVSAADGAEQFYNTTTNETRKEDIATARERDKRIIKAWAGHPLLHVINNHENFDNKLNRVLQEISSVLGLPQPITEERKYIVEVVGDVPGAIESDIVQTFLSADPRTEARLQKRKWQGNEVNVLTTRKRLSPTEQVETERQIANNVYDSLLQQADPYRQPISKRRKSFIWKGQYFNLDRFIAPAEGLHILETKGFGHGEAVRFPPFVRVLEDITANEKYDNYNLAVR